MDLPEFTYCLKGTGDGPTVVVMGSIHGDERMGAQIIDRLRGELTADQIHGTLYFVLGNPAAYVVDKRFVDEDMNRLFGESFSDFSSLSVSELTVEKKRVLQVAPILSKADFLLDIHSTIKPSVPFVYSEPDEAHLRLATLLGTDYVVSASLDFRTPDLVFSSDNFVDRQGGLGVTYETGWHKEDSNVEDVLNNAKRFLQKVGVADFGVALDVGREPVQLLIYGDVIPSTDSFEFSRDFSNFDRVAAGETIAVEDDHTIIADRESFIIFPKKEIYPGKLACYLAYKH